MLTPCLPSITRAARGECFLRPLLTRHRKRLALALFAALLIAALVFWLLRPEPRPLPEIVDAVVRHTTLKVVAAPPDPEVGVYTIEGTTRMTIVATADRAVVRFEGKSRGDRFKTRRSSPAGPSTAARTKLPASTPPAPLVPMISYEGLHFHNIRLRENYSYAGAELDAGEGPNLTASSQLSSGRASSPRRAKTSQTGLGVGGWGHSDTSCCMNPDTLLWYYAVDKRWIEADKPLVVLMLYRSPGFGMLRFLNVTRDIGLAGAIAMLRGSSSSCLDFAYGDCLGPRSVGESAVMSRTVGSVDAYGLRISFPGPPPS